MLLRLAGFEVSLRHFRPTTPTQITQVRRGSPDDTEEAHGECRTTDGSHAANPVWAGQP